MAMPYIASTVVPADNFLGRFKPFRVLALSDKEEYRSCVVQTLSRTELNVSKAHTLCWDKLRKNAVVQLNYCFVS
jgi:hypothetical protein